MSTILNVLRKIKHKIFSNPVQEPNTVYPFIWRNDTFNVSFNINSGIEEFRLKNWGGEQEYTIDMMSKLKTDDVFFDIGSSVGLISIIAAKICSGGKVISFEPDPENAAKLKKNYEINQLTNYEINQIAVGDKRDVLNLFSNGSNGFSPSLKQVNKIEKTIPVEVYPIDELIENKSIPLPNVIKIDIEGAEMMALKGMEKLLKSLNKPRIIFIELHPKFLPEFSTNLTEIFQFIIQSDYKIKNLLQRDDQILLEISH